MDQERLFDSEVITDRTSLLNNIQQAEKNHNYR